LLAYAAAALARRAFLRAGFGIEVPLRHAAAPLAAAAAGLAATLGLLALPLAEPLRFGLAFAGGLLVYWIALRLTLRLTGASLKLEYFVLEPGETAASA
jgi:hypothetical protein